MSLHGASDEFHINICGACKTGYQEKGANFYCNDCPIYLCNPCKEHHVKLPLLKNHVIVLASQVQAASSTQGPPTFIVNCNCSTKQEVIYHCDDHNDVFCNTCKDMKHYKCKVSYIQDKGSGYNTSKLNSVMSKLKALENDYAQLKKTRDAQRNSFGCSKEDCIKEINACGKEVNDFLYDLEKSTLELLDSQVDEGQKRITQHISTLQATEKMLETDDVSRLMGKPTICIGENKDADQRLFFRYSDSKLPLLLISKISSF